jgi:hypothetical protein
MHTRDGPGAATRVAGKARPRLWYAPHARRAHANTRSHTDDATRAAAPSPECVLGARAEAPHLDPQASVPHLHLLPVARGLAGDDGAVLQLPEEELRKLREEQDGQGGARSIKGRFSTACGGGDDGQPGAQALRLAVEGRGPPTSPLRNSASRLCLPRSTSRLMKVSLRNGGTWVETAQKRLVVRGRHSKGGQPRQSRRGWGGWSLRARGIMPTQHPACRPRGRGGRAAPASARRAPAPGAAPGWRRRTAGGRRRRREWVSSGNAAA